MIKKRLFIGSSTEGLKIAKKVKNILANDFDVYIWTDIFGINDNTLKRLLDASLKYDFAIIIGTADDTVSVREEELMQSRDNILFELGLFIGRLGTKKCTFLIEERVKIPSDFHGITLPIFNKNNINKKVDDIKKLFDKSVDNEINFFPSIILASIYFANFISPLCSKIALKECFLLDDQEYDGCSCKVNIIIPDEINDDVNMQSEKLNKEFNFEKSQFNADGRQRSISLYRDKRIENNRIEIVDFPTTIIGINHAIKYLLPKEKDDDHNLILERELNRFVSTIQHSIDDNGFGDIVILKKESCFRKEMENRKCQIENGLGC